MRGQERAERESMERERERVERQRGDRCETLRKRDRGKEAKEETEGMDRKRNLERKRQRGWTEKET